MGGKQTSEIQDIIKSTLIEFTKDYFKNKWKLQERQAINFFTFGYLIKKCKKDSVLYYPAQIAIESTVPQIETGNPRQKEKVSKDLAIWEKPFMNVFDSKGNPTLKPICIIEWKSNSNKLSQNDINWMKEFSKGTPKFYGFCITLNEEKLICAEISKGKIQNKWEFTKNK